jgi:hypothetical protein
MKNILAENMLRFGPKNLSESDKRRLQRLSEAASVPATITLNYDNGMLRHDLLYTRSGDYAWDLNATFKGSTSDKGAALTISELTFVPSDGVANPDTAVTVTVPLVSPFTMYMGENAGLGQGPVWEALKAKFNAGIKVNTKSPELAKVGAGMQADKVFDGVANAFSGGFNMNVGGDILEALYAYCGEKGWYTGPKKDVATMYAVFTNHDGTSQNFY